MTAKRPANGTRPARLALLLGSHLSVAGGLHNALTAAKGYGMACVQVFTKNQRQWSAAPLSAEQIGAWQSARKATGINLVASHASYLINLASATSGTRARSIGLFRDELERCAALGIPALVIHPGAHLGAGEDAGLRLVAAALDQAHADLPGLPVVTCLEITAGQGSSLGCTFEQLRRIIDLCREPDRLGVCLDTAHLLAAGYDLTSAAGARAVLDEADAQLGMARVRVLHINDSKTPRGSRVDRHEHIGHGHIAREAFAAILRDPRLRQVPMILETPKETAPDGRDWDTVNLQTLRRLARPRRKSSA